MKRNYFNIIVYLAIFCLFLIFLSLWWEIESPVAKDQSQIPPRSPFKSYISGVGIVEPSSDNISLTTPLNRMVEKVLVKVGDRVKKNEILLRLDDRDLQANLIAQLASYKSAQAKMSRLEAFPRPEDLADAQATLKSAEAEKEKAKQEYEMVLKLPDPRAISEEEKKRRYFNAQLTEAKWQQAQASFKKIQAGTWKPDLEIARLEVQEASANLNRLKTEIDRTLIRSPIDGTILQLNIHEGEYPSLDQRFPLIIVGNVEEYYLRVSINQLDIRDFKPEAPAVAFFQGDSRSAFPLEFVRIEPYLENKKSLTNEISEKVDTRVLKIIYRIKNENHLLFVGQQMDVFIETERS